MTASTDPDTEELVRRASRGDHSATEQLLVRHRDRLRTMVAVRMDPRLAARFDPSDVIQETLAVASQRLPEYARQQPLPFYPWLREIAWERLIDLHRRHLHAGKRSATREAQGGMGLPDESVMQLARRLISSGTSPSGGVMRDELRRRVREALNELAPHDREMLVMRHLEQLSMSEIAAVLDITERTAKSRHRRALQRLLRAIGNDVTWV